MHGPIHHIKKKAKKSKRKTALKAELIFQETVLRTIEARISEIKEELAGL